MSEEYEGPTELECIDAEITNLKDQLQGIEQADVSSLSSTALVQFVLSKEEIDPFVNPTLTDEAMWAATVPVPRPVVPEVTEEKTCTCCTVV